MRNHRSSIRGGKSIEQLERRCLLAAIQPTIYEQYAIELLNRARANPTAEAARYGIDLNEGLAAGTLGAEARQPLAVNMYLTDSARDHVDWLRANNQFSHTGSGGSTPSARMASAGYGTAGSFSSGENLAVTMNSQAIANVTTEVDKHERNLFVDEGVDGRGHRKNMLNGSLSEIGIGISLGAYTYNNANWQAMLSGQNFGSKSGKKFLTGVVYADTVTNNDFYTPGEGLSGVTIEAEKVGGGTFSTTSLAAGGYSLELAAGTYTVTASGGSLGGTVTFENVVISDRNVKRDFTTDDVVASSPFNISASSGSDTVTVTRNGSTITSNVNGVITNRELASISSITINTGNGNDTITIDDDVIGVTIDAGAGNDRITATDNADSIIAGDGNDYVIANEGDDTVYGGTGKDSLTGSAGRDKLYGENDIDRLNGGTGHDSLYGGSGDDRLYGDDGNDSLDGGGNVDRLWGGAGNDRLIGGGSNDKFYAGIGNDTMTGNAGIDYFNGEAGTDRVTDRIDDEDVVSVEVL